MKETDKQINLNSGTKLYGVTHHTIIETSREALSEVPEKTDQEIYSQPAKETKEEGSVEETADSHVK